MPNKALHRTAIPLRSTAAAEAVAELDCWASLNNPAQVRSRNMHD